MKTVLNVRITFAIILALSLSACFDRSMDVSSLNKMLPSSTLHSDNPFNTVTLDRTAVISGTCHESVHSIRLQVGGQFVYLDQNSSTAFPDTPGLDTDCSDGNYTIPLSNNILSALNLWDQKAILNYEAIYMEFTSSLGYQSHLTITNHNYYTSRFLHIVTLDPATLSQPSAGSTPTLLTSLSNSGCNAITLVGLDQLGDRIPFNLANTRLELVAGNGLNVYNRTLYYDSYCTSPIYSSPTTIGDATNNTQVVYIKPELYNQEAVRLRITNSLNSVVSETQLPLTQTSMVTLGPYSSGTLNSPLVYENHRAYKFSLAISGFIFPNTQLRVELNNVNGSFPLATDGLSADSSAPETSGMHNFYTNGTSGNYFYFKTSRPDTSLQLNFVIYDNYRGDYLMSIPFTLGTTL